jgi:DNA-directed RNA polymerase subunit RPC12/RpoP
MTTPMTKVAHDSGDGQTVYHCPFCGSGQVLARSDRTIECEFCHTAFTVQVQPEFAAFPQTVNGMPMDVPGMPGQVGGGGPPVDPSAVGEDGSVMDPGDPMQSDAEATEENEQGQDEDNPDAAANPFTSKLYRTEAGALLSEEDFLAHLAIKHSPNPKATAAMVKAARKQAANDHLPAHLQQDWGNKTVNPMDKPHFCLQQSKKTPSIPWHNTVMKYDNGVPQHQECLGCHKKFPVNTDKDGWNSI